MDQGGPGDHRRRSTRPPSRRHDRRQPQLAELVNAFRGRCGPYPTCTIPSPLHSGQIGRETERAVPTVPAPSQTPQLGQSSCRRNSGFSIACFFGSATICDNPPLLAHVVASIGRGRRPCPDQIGVIPVILVFHIAWTAVVASIGVCRTSWHSVGLPGQSVMAAGRTHAGSARVQTASRVMEPDDRDIMQGRHSAGYERMTGGLGRRDPGE